MRWGSEIQRLIEVATGDENGFEPEVAVEQEKISAGVRLEASTIGKAEKLRSGAG